jgi:hypothetical protein
MAALIKRHGDRYFLQIGRLDALRSWLGRLPDEVVSGDPWLMYFQGVSILHGHPAEALDILSRATDTAEKKGDLKCQLRALFLMIAAHTFANNLEKVKETTRRIPVVASLIKSSWSRGVVLVAALSRAVWEDNLRRGAWLSWLSGTVKLDPESQMGRLMFSSMIQFRLGNLSAAKKLIEKALRPLYPGERTVDRHGQYYLHLYLHAHRRARENGKNLQRVGAPGAEVRSAAPVGGRLPPPGPLPTGKWTAEPGQAKI